MKIIWTNVLDNFDEECFILAVLFVCVGVCVSVCKRVSFVCLFDYFCVGGFVVHLFSFSLTNTKSFE